jgi:hypothetical protein
MRVGAGGRPGFQRGRGQFAAAIAAVRHGRGQRTKKAARPFTAPVELCSEANSHSDSA